MTKLHGINTPHISQYLLDKLSQAFPIRKVKDNDSLIAIGRHTGQQEVIEWLHKFLSDSYVSGDQEDVDIKSQEYSPTQRLFKNLKPNREYE